MKIDGRVGYVDMNFEFKCEWKCESMVGFSIVIVIEKDTNWNRPTIG